MDNIAGPPVEGENFFGRNSIVKAFWQDLQHHDVLLLGPRRIGKTSLGRRVMRVATEHGWRAVEVNVAKCTDEKEFVEKLAKAFYVAASSWSSKSIDVIRSGLTELMGRVKGIRLGPVEVDLQDKDEAAWSVAAADLLRLIAQIKDPWLIYLDELPIFLFHMVRNDPNGGVKRVRQFLDWFRNDVRSMPECKDIRWLVSGSVGLDTLVQRYQMADTINSFRHKGLKPFSPPEANLFLERLATSYGVAFAPKDYGNLVNAIGWPQPYYLQRAFHNVRELLHEKGGNVGDVIDEAVARLADHDSDNDFHHYELRLALQLGKEDGAHAVALLKLACRDIKGTTPEVLVGEIQRRTLDLSPEEQEQKFIQIRDVLVRDAYWWCEESGGIRRYRFCLEPLRKWWLRRHTL